MTVVTTAPTYLFWRCAPPELRVPREFLTRSAGAAAARSRSARTARRRRSRRWRKLGVDVVVRGECEEVVARARRRGGDLRARAGHRLPRRATTIRVTGGAAGRRFVDAAARSRWPDAWIARHRHHHHRFDARPDGPGAEVEASRGCPYACTFCAKIDFRDRYRRRELDLRARRDRRADRAGRRATSTSSTRSSCRRRRCSRRWSSAAVQLRRADPHRPVEAGHARPAGRAPAASRSRPGSRA